MVVFYLDVLFYYPYKRIGNVRNVYFLPTDMDEELMMI